MTTCPSGVRLHASGRPRPRAYRGDLRRPLLDRLTARCCSPQVLPYPRTLPRWRSLAAGSARPFAPLIAALGLKPLAAMLALAPTRAAARRSTATGRGLSAPRARAGAARGAARGLRQQVLAPVDQRGRHPAAQPPRRRGGGRRGRGCCGALVHHMGREDERARAWRARNIDAWTARDRRRGARRHPHHHLGLRHHGQGLRLHAAPDPAMRRGARQASSALAATSPSISPSSASRRRRRRPGYASPITPPARCSTASGSRASRRTLLAQAGFTVREMPEAICAAARPAPTTCCSRRSPAQLRDRKVENIARPAPDIVATGNIGCITQIARGTAMPSCTRSSCSTGRPAGPCPQAAGEAQIQGPPDRESFTPSKKRRITLTWTPSKVGRNTPGPANMCGRPSLASLKLTAFAHCQATHRSCLNAKRDF